MPSLICVPLAVLAADSALRDAHAAKAAGADLVEFRLDDFFHGDEAQIVPIVRLVSDSPLPCIATCRVASEGGHYDGPDDARIALFERLGTAFGNDEHPPRYLDVELSTYERSANIRQKIKLAIDHPEQVRDLQTSLILSLHDFQGPPPKLARRMLDMSRHPAAKVLKIAFKARSLRDNAEIAHVLAYRDRPTIALAMGEFGLMSRVLAPKLGGFLTYASLCPAAATAPGQPTISELLKLYRFRSIDENTVVHGVVGWPVAQSLSPHIHNAGFETTGRNSVYLPLPVVPGYESLKATLLELILNPAFSIRGLSITHPHKENLVRLALEQRWHVDEASSSIGAANTLTVTRNHLGAVAGVEVSNTDAPALIDALNEAVGHLAGRRIAIVGAGGTARAGAYAISNADARVQVFSRSPEKSAAIAQAFPGATSHALSEFPQSEFDVLINCTPVGMTGGPDPAGLPIDGSVLRTRPGAVVMDTVYNPIETPLLRAAREAGLRTLSGVTMFVNQAALQFQNWTGAVAPKGLFERTVQEHLA